MSARVILLAGKRGCGKTTIASALEQRGFARASFGSFVRAVATLRRVGNDVPALEALGTKLIAELGWESFCRQVLAGTEAANRVVVNGIRHCAARDAIRRIVLPRRAALVFVEVDEDERTRRLLVRGRAGDDPRAAEMSDDLAQLREEADLLIDGASNQGANQVLTYLRSYLPPAGYNEWRRRFAATTARARGGLRRRKRGPRYWLGRFAAAAAAAVAVAVQRAAGERAPPMHPLLPSMNKAILAPAPWSMFIGKRRLRKSENASAKTTASQRGRPMIFPRWLWTD